MSNQMQANLIIVKYYTQKYFGRKDLSSDGQITIVSDQYWLEKVFTGVGVIRILLQLGTNCSLQP